MKDPEGGGRGVSTFVVVVAVAMTAAIALPFIVGRHEPEPRTIPKIYHDARRGVTCYMIPQAITCLLDSELFPAR